MKKAYVFALSLLAVPALADNNRGFYAGVGLSYLINKEDEVGGATKYDTDAKPIRAAELLVGYKYNNLLGIEVRGGSGSKEGVGDIFLPSDHKNSVGQIKREIDGYKSIYYRPELTNDDAKLYALLGYTKVNTVTTNMTDTAGAVLLSTKKNYSGYSYGIGAGFVIGDYVNLNIEYKNLCEDFANKPNVATVSLDYRF